MIRNLNLRYGLLLVLIACLPACQASGPAVEFKGQRFAVELAIDDASRTKGLMFRDSMAQDHGMLFIFGDERPRSFWMKNTRIPLDIFYFDAQQRLVSVSENARPCRTARCPSYPSAGAARYVLELNAGLAEMLDAKPGDKIQFIGFDAAPGG